MGVLDRQIVALVKLRDRHTPRILALRLALLQGDKLLEVCLGEGIGLAERTVEIQLVEPHLAGRLALPEEENHGLDARLEDARRQIEHRMQVALLEQLAPQGYRRIVGVAQEGVLDDDARFAARPQILDEVFQKEIGGLARLDGEVLLHLAPLLASEGGIGKDVVEPVLLLDIGKILGERIGVDDVGRLHAVQNHVHRGDDEGQRLVILAGEGSLLQDAFVLGTPDLLVHVGIRFAQKACRAACTVVDRLADPGIDDPDDGADQRTRCVVFAAVASRIAHPVEAAFVPVGHLVALLGGLEVQFIHLLQYVAEVVAALDAVADLGEDDADLDFDGFRGSRLLEFPQIGEELVVDELDEVVAHQRVGYVVVSLGIERDCPVVPAVPRGDNGCIEFVLQLGSDLSGLLEIVEVLEEEDPRGLLDVIQFARAPLVGAQAVVEVFDGLFESHELFVFGSGGEDFFVNDTMFIIKVSRM